MVIKYAAGVGIHVDRTVLFSSLSAISFLTLWPRCDVVTRSFLSQKVKTYRWIFMKFGESEVIRYTIYMDTSLL